MKPMVITKEPLGNAASVRKYYRNHRDAIITRKTLHACSQDGRIPRWATVQKHNSEHGSAECICSMACNQAHN